MALKANKNALDQAIYYGGKLIDNAKDYGKAGLNALDPRAVIRETAEEVANTTSRTADALGGIRATADEGSEEFRQATERLKQVNKDKEYADKHKSSILGGAFIGTKDIDGNKTGGLMSTAYKYATAQDVDDMRFGVGAMRTGAMLFAGGSAARMVTGNGSPMTNQYGERDIAGIPFI